MKLSSITAGISALFISACATEPVEMPQLSRAGAYASVDAGRIAEKADAEQDAKKKPAPIQVSCGKFQKEIEAALKTIENAVLQGCPVEDKEIGSLDSDIIKTLSGIFAPIVMDIKEGKYTVSFDDLENKSKKHPWGNFHVILTDQKGNEAIRMIIDEGWQQEKYEVSFFLKGGYPEGAWLLPDVDLKFRYSNNSEAPDKSELYLESGYIIEKDDTCTDSESDPNKYLTQTSYFTCSYSEAETINGNECAFGTETVGDTQVCDLYEQNVKCPGPEEYGEHMVKVECEQKGGGAGEGHEAAIKREKSQQKNESLEAFGKILAIVKPFFDETLGKQTAHKSWLKIKAKI